VGRADDMKYEVSFSGYFCYDVIVDAKDEEDAKLKVSRMRFDKLMEMVGEDFSMPAYTYIENFLAVSEVEDNDK
jgi:hypothetical protein